MWRNTLLKVQNVDWSLHYFPFDTIIHEVTDKTWILSNSFEKFGNPTMKTLYAIFIIAFVSIKAGTGCVERGSGRAIAVYLDSLGMDRVWSAGQLFQSSPVH